MKLLFITQKIDKNDDTLGVYHRWAEELAKRFDQLQIICLYQGRTELPSNARVYSLGKESGSSRLKYVWNFWRYIWKLRKDYDKVFVHMNPEYMILGGWFWKLIGKEIIFWYAHYLATLQLRVAAFFADKIVTSTRLAYPLPSKKLTVLQQGIDTERFRPSGKSKQENGNFKILFLGRIAPVKNLDVLLRSIALVCQKNSNLSLTIVGSPTIGRSTETEYFEKIKKLAGELNLKNKINFQAAVPNYGTPEIYSQHDLFVNLTPTGSFDKTTLEAMACGLSVIVSNLAFRNIFPENLASKLMFQEKNENDLAKKLENFLNLPDSEKLNISRLMRSIILEKHDLIKLMDRLTNTLKEKNYV